MDKFIIYFINGIYQVGVVEDNKIYPLKKEGEIEFTFNEYDDEDFWEWFKDKTTDYEDEEFSFIIVSDVDFKIPSDIKISKESKFKQNPILKTFSNVKNVKMVEIPKIEKVSKSNKTNNSKFKEDNNYEIIDLPSIIDKYYYFKDNFIMIRDKEIKLLKNSKLKIENCKIVIENSKFKFDNSKSNKSIEIVNSVGSIDNSMFENYYGDESCLKIDSRDFIKNSECLLIQNSIFNNNHSNNEGGGLYIDNVTVKNCYFNNCSAEFGGGIFASENNSISDCEFNNCSAKYGGGGIYAYENNSISNSIYQNCKPDNIIYS